MNTSTVEQIAHMKQHITHFSEELKHKAKHGQDVVIGGYIKSITPLIDDLEPMSCVVIDDLVGKNHVFISAKMIDAFPDSFQIGKEIYLEGFVNVITRHIKNEIVRDISVFIYGLKDISKEVSE